MELSRQPDAVLWRRALEARLGVFRGAAMKRFLSFQFNYNATINLGEWEAVFVFFISAFRQNPRRRTNEYGIKP